MRRAFSHRARGYGIPEEQFAGLMFILRDGQQAGVGFADIKGHIGNGFSIDHEF